MKLLAIDTSTEHFSVCYFNNNHISEQNILGSAKSSSLILKMIQEITDLKDLDGLVYAKGPGAFTGVRVGIGVIQGLSLAKDIPTLGFSTLEVLEFGAIQKYKTNKVISSIDARMGEVYYRHQGIDSLINPKNLTKKYSDYIGVGTGFETYDNFAGCNKIYTNFYPQAKNLISLALNNMDNFSFKNLEPLYLRNNVAKKSTKI